jgi:hypothetical protein
VVISLNSVNKLMFVTVNELLNIILTSFGFKVAFGGLVVSVLVTGHDVRRFKPG